MPKTKSTRHDYVFKHNGREMVFVLSFLPWFQVRPYDFRSMRCSAASSCHRKPTSEKCTREWRIRNPRLAFFRVSSRWLVAWNDASLIRRIGSLIVLGRIRNQWTVRNRIIRCKQRSYAVSMPSTAQVSQSLSTLMGNNELGWLIRIQYIYIYI